MKKLLGTLAFWGLVILGPGVVMLWNWISYITAGLGYGEGSLFYNALLLISQGAACGMAYIAVVSITGEPGGYCARYNCLICAVAMFGLMISDIMQGETIRAISLGIGAIVSCVCLSRVIKDYGDTAKNEKQEAVEGTDTGTPRKGLPRSNWWKVMLVVIAAAAALYGAWYFGVRCGVKAQMEIMTEQMETAVEEAKAEGMREQREIDQKGMNHNKHSSAMIAYNVNAEYGMNPERAYEIVEAYNASWDHGGYSWDTYQTALAAVLYTASLFAGN